MNAGLLSVSLSRPRHASGRVSRIMPTAHVRPMTYRQIKRYISLAGFCSPTESFYSLELNTCQLSHHFGKHRFPH